MIREETMKWMHEASNYWTANIWSVPSISWTCPCATACGSAWRIHHWQSFNSKQPVPLALYQVYQTYLKRLELKSKILTLSDFPGAGSVNNANSNGDFASLSSIKSMIGGVDSGRATEASGTSPMRMDRKTSSMIAWPQFRLTSNVKPAKRLPVTWMEVPMAVPWAKFPWRRTKSAQWDLNKGDGADPCLRRYSW